MHQNSTLDFADLVERSHQMALAVRHRYGMSRLELGLLLDTIQQQQLWHGKASSFLEYVDDLRLNRNACRTYMKVARKFIVELGVSQAVLYQLAACNMGVLEHAANVITPDNAEDVISAILALHQRDATAMLQDFQSPEPKSSTDDVTRLFNRFMELPDDRRIDFLHRLRPKSAIHQTT